MYFYVYVYVYICRFRETLDDLSFSEFMSAFICFHNKTITAKELVCTFIFICVCVCVRVCMYVYVYVFWSISVCICTLKYYVYI